VGQLMTNGHSAMLCDLTEAVLVSTDCPLGLRTANNTDNDNLRQYHKALDDYVQQCRHDAGTLAYRLPSCRVRSVVVVVVVVVVVLLCSKYHKALGDAGTLA